MTTCTVTDHKVAIRQRFLMRGPSGSEDAASRQVVYGLVHELVNAGFVVNPTDVENISAVDAAPVVRAVREIMGADRTYKTLYPGFPEQVKLLDTIDLLINQIVHYFTGLHVPGEATVRPDADTSIARLKVLKVVDAEELYAHAISFVQQPTAMSPDQEAVVSLAVRQCRDKDNITPDHVKSVIAAAANTENIQSYIMALHAALVSEQFTDVIVSAVDSARNPDMLLRIVLGAYTSPVKSDAVDQYERAVRQLHRPDRAMFRVGSIPRVVRHKVLSTLGRVTTDYDADALVRRAILWQRVMRTIHPYSMSLTKKDKAVARAVDIIHNPDWHDTLDSVFERLLDSPDAQADAVALLRRHRPRDLFVKTVRLLSIENPSMTSELNDGLAEFAPRVRMAQLIKTYDAVLGMSYTGARVDKGAQRQVFASRDRSKIDNQGTLDVLSDAIRQRFATVPAEGVTRVGIVSDAPVPTTGARDAASTDSALQVGQRVPLSGNGDTLRMFVHWRNGEHSRVDLDLGAILLDEYGNTLDQVTWNTYYTYGQGYATYSGDVTNAPGKTGAAEFIDVDVQSLNNLYPEARYVVTTVVSYTRQEINTVDHVAGALYVDARRGENFQPRKVVSASTSQHNATVVALCAYDLERREMVWLDATSGSKNVHSIANDSGITSAIQDALFRPRVTWGDLAVLFAEAHDLPTESEPVDQQLLTSVLTQC